MKLDSKTPCASCPYRKDVPVETWHPEEFENLLAQDADEPNGAVFGCHKYRNRPPEEHTVCAGWFIDQRERRFPSLRLRVLLMSKGTTADEVDEFNDGGHELYPSIEAMCRANGVTVARKRPPRPPRR